MKPDFRRLVRHLRVQAEMNKALGVNEERCPECKCQAPGHRILCKTGNERAKRYQDKLRRAAK